MSEIEKKEGEPKKKLFNFVMGNPPYQEDKKKDGTRPNPVYHTYMDAVYRVSDVTELITPGRFLFDAGQTPKKWNEKMLNDEHLKVLSYESDAQNVFPRIGLEGGVTVTIRDEKKEYGKIGAFSPIEELRTIHKKVSDKTADDEYLNTIVSPKGMYRLTSEFFKDYPFATERLGKGTGNMIASNFFEVIPEVNIYSAVADTGLTPLLARVKGHRVTCYLPKKYIQDNSYLSFYNVFVPKANGSPAIGYNTTTALIGMPVIGEPMMGHTGTFLSIGQFNTKEEAEACLKYIKTKFARCLLGILKVTQENPSATWKYVPLQNFTTQSDIDWSVPIPEIDKQLYAKYGLYENEIEFIESHIKPMN